MNKMINKSWADVNEWIDKPTYKWLKVQTNKLNLDFHHAKRFYAQAHYLSFTKSTVSWRFSKCEPDPFLNNDKEQWKELNERMTVSDRKWGSATQLSFTSQRRHTASPWKQKSI